MKARSSFVSLSALLLLSFASCASGPSIETFFVDSGVQQYFVYPSEMRGQGCKAMVDFTYRTSNDYVVCNLSISAVEGVSRDYADLVFALDNAQTVAMKDVGLIVMNRLEKEIRLSCHMPLADFRALISSANASLGFSLNGKRYSVQGGPYFKVQMKAARTEIIDDD